MQYFYRLLILSVFFSALTACGNGGSSTSSNSKPSDLDLNSSSIFGTLKAAANIDVDSDTNDSETPSIDNSSFASAQSIENFVTLQGFVSKVATSTFNQYNNQRILDRFYLRPDQNDTFKVQLQAGQIVQLEVVNQAKPNNPEPELNEQVFSGDLDLYLHDEYYNLVNSAFSLNKYESLIIPKNGLYYIRVKANSGASKYILRLQPPEESTANQNLFQPALDFIANELIIQYQNNTATHSFKASSDDLHTIHPGINRPTLASLNKAQTYARAQSNTLLSELASLNYPAYEKVQTITKLKELQQQANIKSVSLNYIRTAQKTPSDQYFPYQWHYPLINLPQAWDITTGLPETGSVIVAVIDTGIFSDHPDLKNKLVSGYDFISNDQNSNDDEPGIDSNPEDVGDGLEPGTSSWHGTHVAGTIAAQSDNNIGVAGVSWGAKIMPLRVLGRNGGSNYDIMQAIRFAAGLENDSNTLPDKPADIINLSLGGAGSSPAEAALFQELHDKGIIVVAAAGNNNSSSHFYPASYDKVISVSAIGFNRLKSPYSNFGSKIDIAAPGGDLSKNLNQDAYDDGILSTSLDDTSGNKQAQYSFYEGTSMAAPHIAGTFALMKAVFPQLSPTNVDTLLAAGALTDDAGANGRDNLYGYGIINALKAVQAAVALEAGGNTQELQASILAQPSSLNFSASQQANLLISNEGGGSPHLQTVLTNRDWLSIRSIDADQHGFGRYQVNINPENLSGGFHFGTIRFIFDDTTLSVQVSYSIGKASSEGEIATIYALLIDYDSDLIIQETYAKVDDSGNTHFSFRQVPQGNYYVISGTDIDNDGYICQLGEACAVYPPSNQISPISNFDLDTISIEMTANIINSLNSFYAPDKQSKATLGVKREIKALAISLVAPTKTAPIKQLKR